MKKTMPSIRVTDESLEHIEKAIYEYNKNNLIKISKQEFRRLSYELLSQLILQHKLKDLDVKFE